jgi:hypothetical protein
MVADNARQFDLVRNTADGELSYLHGVIEFYQTTLIVKSTLVGQRQNDEIQRMSEASYSQNEDVKRISAWAAIFFAPTLIGTIYGMTFEHMPGAALAARLTRCPAVDGRHVCDLVPGVQTAPLAVAGRLVVRRGHG